jgi:hypothetical protein
VVVSSDSSGVNPLRSPVRGICGVWLEVLTLKGATKLPVAHIGMPGLGESVDESSDLCR